MRPLTGDRELHVDESVGGSATRKAPYGQLRVVDVVKEITRVKQMRNAILVRLHR